MPERHDPAPPLKVFISYSRKDEAFARDLLAGLEVAGIEPFLDQHDIAAGEAWELRLRRLIESADAVVVVLSPDSLASARCGWEIDRAHELSKRLLPIVARAVEEGAVPERLRQINYIFFDRPFSFGAALKSLVGALNTDVDWVREHTRIGEAALRWDGRGRPEALLTRGDELASTRAWLKQQPRYAPEPTLLMLDFLKAGEDAEQGRSNVEQQRLDEIRIALEREKSAQDAREQALARERAALRRGQRALAGAGAAMVCVVAGAIGWYNQQTLREHFHWRVRMHPEVLAAADEVAKAAAAGGTFTECANGCPAMVVVPAGKFTMGTPETEAGRTKDEGPKREVTIAKPFAVGRTEVTIAAWDHCVASGACPEASDNGWGRGTRPVIYISWEAAKAYADWLSRMTGKRYRLLSEAEWEYAARAGTPEETFTDGDERLGRIAWYKSNSGGKTQPVGTLAANAFGLHDMRGNVYEWLEDQWHETYDGAPSDGSAWIKDGDPSRRVVRGGSWSYPAVTTRFGDRNRVTAALRIGDLGFRIARTLGE